MEIQYRCNYPKRLATVKNLLTLNAIDYIEVLDNLAPSQSLRQRILFLHCVKAISGITINNLRIEGGVRRAVKPIRVSVAADMTDSLNDQPADYRTSVLDDDAPARVLIVETDSAGDFSSV
jgi:hypothetical protein